MASKSSLQWKRAPRRKNLGERGGGRWHNVQRPPDFQICSPFSREGEEAIDTALYTIISSPLAGRWQPP